MLAPNWITVKHHQTIKSWITIQWFSLDFARTDPFEVLIADVSQTPTVLWTVGLPLISASFHHTALSHVSWITWIRGNVTLEFSFCTTEMVEISCPYHPCDQCPGAFQQGGSNAPERQCNSQRPPEAKVSPVFPVSPGGFDSVPQILHLGPISRQTQPVTVQTDTRNMMKHITICHTVNPVSHS